MEMSKGNLRLPCGTELGRLVDQVAEARPPDDPTHERTCRHCKGALWELNSLWGDVRELAREEVSAPARVIETVMRRIRHTRRSGSTPTVPLEEAVPLLVRHALLHGVRGTLRIADSVVATVVRRAALSVAGVRELAPPRALRTGAAPFEEKIFPAGVTIDVDGPRVTIALSLVVGVGQPIPEVVESVRERVAEAVEQLTGLQIDAIDITVAEIDTDG